MTMVKVSKFISTTLFLALLAILGLLVLCLAGKTDYRVNITPSMPGGIYKIKQWDGVTPFKRGELVSMCLSPEFSKIALERGYLRPGMCPGGAQALLKEIVAIEDDDFSLTGEGVAVNGRLLENSAPRTQDSKGRPMAFSRTLKAGKIPSGFALLLSTHHPGSYDSRYFGLVPLSAMDKAEPVWIWTF